MSSFGLIAIAPHVEQAATPGHLQLTTDILSLPPIGYHHLGSIAVSFWLRNTTAIRAEIPFLSFSKLGLKLVAEPGWMMENRTTAGGKRSQVFSPLSGNLVPDGLVNPCSLHVDVIARGGGAVRLMLGQERSVWDQTDICVPCRVGAGNFPSESVIVSICGVTFSKVARSVIEAKLRAAEFNAGLRGLSGRVIDRN